MKYEYALKETINTTNLAQKTTKKLSLIYNNIRTHLRLDLNALSSVQLHQNVPYKSYRKKNKTWNI